MGRIRQFTTEDIPRVVELNQKLFPESKRLSSERQEYLFNEICFHNPWYDDEISSLVYEEGHGMITGFLGVVPRRMSFDGRPIRVAVSQHLMVDKSALASLQLFKTFLSGPQDLSMTDMSIDVARTIWERLGGSTVFAHSIYWRRPLQPLTFAIPYLRKKKKAIQVTSKKILPFIDSIFANIPGNPLRPIKPSVTAKDLTIEEFLENIPKFTLKYNLRPEYDYNTITWLFNMLDREKRFGDLHKVVVYNLQHEMLGWYLVNLNHGGRSEVIQVVGRKDTIKTVIEHLFYTAWNGGSIELVGRLDPDSVNEFPDKFCLFMPGRNWMLVHSRQPDIIEAIQSNHAFLTRLEGDLWFL